MLSNVFINDKFKKPVQITTLCNDFNFIKPSITYSNACFLRAKPPISKYFDFEMYRRLVEASLTSPLMGKLLQALWLVRSSLDLCSGLFSLLQKNNIIYGNLSKETSNDLRTSK